MHLDADRDAEQRGLTVRAVPLAGGEHRRHDHGAGMHRPALEGIVEILAMRRGAVDERRAGGAQRARMADRRARAVVIEGGQRAPDIVLVARGDAQPDDVDQQVLALALAPRPAGAPDQARDALGKLFGDGGAGSSFAHGSVRCCAGGCPRRSPECG